MNRTRLILIVVLVLILVGAGAAFFVLQNGGLGGNTGGGTGGTGGGQVAQNNSPTPAVTLEPTLTPIPLIEVVIAVQDIPRGVIVQPNMVGVITFPQDYVPVRAYSNVQDVIGRIARTDIYRENFILSNQLVEDLSNLGSAGSDAAAILDPSRVAVSLPIDAITSVAYALKPGDRVDVIVSMLFVDIDPDFQSIEPSNFQLLSILNSLDPTDPTGVRTITTVSIGGGGEGEFDTRRIPDGDGGILNWPILLSPSEDQRPRLTTQRTVQDAQVVWMGEFPDDGVLFRPAATPTPVVTPDPNATEAPPDAPPTPTPVPPRPDIITLAVRPQDAVVLTYMAEAGLPLTFALRSARSQGLPPTDPVTLDYIMTTFNILVPERFNYGVEPAIRSIRSLSLGNTITLGQ